MSYIYIRLNLQTRRLVLTIGRFKTFDRKRSQNLQTVQTGHSGPIVQLLELSKENCSIHEEPELM